MERSPGSFEDREGHVVNIDGRIYVSSTTHQEPRAQRSYRVKYDKAVACLTKDRDAVLTFYDFPAEHWKHL